MQTTTLVVFTFIFDSLYNLYLYTMIDYLIAALFVLSLAIASGGILISSHLRTTYKTDFMSSLLFFEVFWFTFGFYALWGQIILVSLLESLVQPELFVKINSITILLGSPFLVFAWLMYLKLTKELSGRKKGNMFIALFLTINCLLVPGIGYLLTMVSDIKLITLVKYIFVLFSILYTITGSYSLLSGKKKQTRLRYADIKNISFWLLLIMVLQNTFLILSENHIYFSLAFILLFYGFGGFMPLYFRYRTDLSKLLIPGENNLSFDRFCEKFEISKREKEVIHEICSGLSNQQIADKLFISLQTVKDHTHRIYSKTDCTGRARLMRMVNESI
jgi:DNA-binding CsgD family transcriptional regulator